MIPISLCIITKNEETKLKKCLEAVKDLPFEIIVADTGSTDGTVDIAKQYTDNVYHFDWINDFAAARNFSISKASHDWILVLDSDEYVTEIDLDEIYRLIEENPTGVGRLLRSSDDIAHTVTMDRVERLFNKNIYEYKRPIHEQVLPIKKDTPFSAFSIPLYVDHEGYVGTQEDIDKKAKRNLKILLASEKDFPDSYTYFQIGQSYYIMKEYKNARKYFEKGLNFNLAVESEYVQLMVVNYTYTLLHLGETEKAIEFCEALGTAFDFYADFVFALGYSYFKNQNYIKAGLKFIQATQTEDFLTLGTNSFLAFYYLGIIYEMLGDFKLARTFYEKCGDFEKALICIKELDERGL